ncbi:MAG: response regulator [Desulfuromonadaceae bacterium]|nr:response regulator [Desulfuromonadaceae bacterium]MDD2849386.1 response regulator [Desulfuromonadaceae bacterium]MDD4130046.1 response regulator [Desulfuromonadaceae bacterium]
MMIESGAPAVKPTVVIIDDDRNVLELTSLILLKHGFQSYVADGANEGFELIATHSPELVLLDYMMPEMDGLSALQFIKNHFPDTYVVMLTGKGSEEVAVELMKNGASEYILKPFNNRNLVERLKNVMRIREIELHNRELQKQQVQLLSEIEQWNLELKRRVREKTEELHNAHEEIVQSEKLAAMGYLSAGVAHEIRNPLNSIALFVQLMRQTTTEPDQLEHQAKIMKEVDRIDSIIRKLLDASRRTRVISSTVQINQVIDNAIEAFTPQIETRKIQVERQYHCVPPPITADPTELEQIFTNLFLNALDAMSRGGRLAIELFAKDGRVIVRVGDSGHGIAEDVLPSIFEPFFSTKGRGTGMGLPVAQRIARMYEGSMEVECSSSEGTTFRLEFPFYS